MPKDAHASLRLPADLKREVENISKSQSRPVSSTLELLVRRGINLYKEDGILVEDRSSKRQRKTKVAAEEDLAQRMADMVAERILDRIQQIEDRQKDSEENAA